MDALNDTSFDIPQDIIALNKNGNKRAQVFDLNSISSAQPHLFINDKKKQIKDKAAKNKLQQNKLLLNWSEDNASSVSKLEADNNVQRKESPFNRSYHSSKLFHCLLCF